MATNPAIPVELTPSDIHFIRSLKILEEVKLFMQFILCQGTMNRNPSESLLDYMKRMGREICQFQNKLNRHQKHLIHSFPDVSSFDITLSFLCIQFGCNRLADRNDNVWKGGNDSLESYLTELKNWGNEIWHEVPQYDDQSFFNQTEKICSLLTKGIQKAGEIYGIHQTTIDTKITELNDRISKIRDQSWLIMDFKHLQQTTLYSQKVNYIKKEGTICLFGLYTGWIVICPSPLLCKAKFKVEEIYTELILKSEELSSQNKVQKLEDLFDGIKHKNSDPILLLEGHAGSGKSTITKKILSEWSNSQNSAIRNLSNYDLLLYTEFRKKNINSFKDLVSHLMPEIASSFYLEDLCKIIQDMKTLVILDGLDELNESSSSLFEEILQLKATKRISVMVTTRPERIKTYYSLTHINNLKTKHIMISGIAEEKRKEFVQKYYKEMEKEGETHEDITLLLQYLKKTAKHLSHLWQLPYNLTLLVCLWVYKPKAVNSITTSSELYWECYELYKSKLSDRLLLNKATKDWDKSLKEDKIDKFMALLGEFALKRLGNDMIELSEDEHKDLKRHCIDEGLPTDEMTGAFLKMTQVKTNWGYETTYSFPHKSLQDFLAALNVCKKAEEKTRILKKRTISDSSSPSTSSGVTEEANIIRTKLSNASGSSGFDIMNYQNVLIGIVGLFYLRKSLVLDSIKIEVLNLLGETGVTDKYRWLNILDTVKFDQFVANFINEKHNIFTGQIHITDSNIYAFNSLLQTLSSPISDPDKVIININIKEQILFISPLIKNIMEKRFKMDKLINEYDFRNPVVSSVSADVIASLMQRCPLRSYQGFVPEKIENSQPIEDLRVSINTSESYDALLQHLGRHKPYRFEISLSADMDSRSLNPLPQGLNDSYVYPGPVCYITDVTQQNYLNASVILFKIQPTDGFRSVYFPRCSLTEKQHFISLLQEMKMNHNIRVNSREIFFPGSNLPSSYQEIQEEANPRFGYNVLWSSYLNNWQNK